MKKSLMVFMSQGKIWGNNLYSIRKHVTSEIRLFDSKFFGIDWLKRNWSLIFNTSLICGLKHLLLIIKGALTCEV